MDPYNEATAAGLLEPYDAINASNLISDTYKDADNNWYGIYKGILGFMVNREEIERLGIEEPKDWDDLLKPEYKGLIGISNPSTAGTAKLVINTMVQMKGHDEAMEYFKLKLDDDNYSKAFKQYRKEWVEDHIVIIFTGVLLILCVPLAIGKVRSIKEEIDHADIFMDSKE